MSVRGVMICETSTSPSSITPSIISRASSSSRPSRCPSVTMRADVFVERFLVGRPAAAAGQAVQGDVDEAGHQHQRPAAARLSARQTGQVRNRNGSAQSRATAQGIQISAASSSSRAGQQAAGQPAPVGDAGGRPAARAQSAAAPRRTRPRPATGAFRRPGPPARAAQDLAQPVGPVPPAADLLQLVRRELGQRPGADRRQAASRPPRPAKGNGAVTDSADVQRRRARAACSGTSGARGDSRSRASTSRSPAPASGPLGRAVASS